MTCSPTDHSWPPTPAEQPNTPLLLTDQARCVRGDAAHLLRPPAAEWHVGQI